MHHHECTHFDGPESIAYRLLMFYPTVQHRHEGHAMPTGPNGEKRPADVIANAVLSMRIATGDTEEAYVNTGKREGGRKGGKARASSMSAERRHQIAKAGGEARWSNRQESK